MTRSKIATKPPTGRQAEIAGLLMQHLIRPGLPGASRTLIRRASRKWRPDVKVAVFIARTARELVLPGVDASDEEEAPDLFGKLASEVADATGAAPEPVYDGPHVGESCP